VKVDVSPSIYTLSFGSNPSTSRLRLRLAYSLEALRARDIELDDALPISLEKYRPIASFCGVDTLCGGWLTRYECWLVVQMIQMMRNKELRSARNTRAEAKARQCLIRGTASDQVQFFDTEELLPHAR
jgi:hypothetical protein